VCTAGYDYEVVYDNYPGEYKYSMVYACQLVKETDKVKASASASTTNCAAASAAASAAGERRGARKEAPAQIYSIEELLKYGDSKDYEERQQRHEQELTDLNNRKTAYMERYRKEEKSIKQTISQLKKKQLILAEATKNYQHYLDELEQLKGFLEQLGPGACADIARDPRNISEFIHQAWCSVRETMRDIGEFPVKDLRSILSDLDTQRTLQPTDVVAQKETNEADPQQSTLRSALPAHVERAEELERVAETKVLADETNKADPQQSTLQSALPAHVGRAEELERVAETEVLVDETNKAEQSTLQSTLPAHVGRAKEPERVAETKVLVDETNKAEHVDRAEKLETVDRGPCCALGLGDMTTNTGFTTEELVEFAESMQ